MVRKMLRAGVAVAALTGAVVVAITVGQQSRRRRSLLWAGAPGVAGVKSSSEEKLEFYHLSSRSVISVPLSNVRKRRTVRTNEGGQTRERYSVVSTAMLDGRPVRLFKFVSRQQFQELAVPEEETAS
ncbi:MAG: hypothetical protein ACREN8_01845 [Candidatus Dormibacteraceae bacterium]